MSLIDSFLTDDYDVERSAPGTYVNGRYVPGAREKLKVCGSLQPTSAREIKMPEEGNRLKQYWKFYTDEKILLNNPATLSDSDHIMVNGESYRAMASTQYQGTDLDYFMTIIWREPQQINDGKGAA